MASYTLPPVSSISEMPPSERIAILDFLFEPSQSLHTLSLDLLHQQSFTSYNDIIATIGSQLTDLAKSKSTSDTDRLEKILVAHPRLGEKRVESAQSRAEQAQLNQGEESQASELMSLNDEYERTFPGLKYVVFVNGRERHLIMNDMRTRIQRGDIQLERVEAIKAMCEIAADRTSKASPAP